MPIEPVGVIVLAIDGLRQDVLYAQNEQQVQDPDPAGDYYIDPTKLKGMCEVLGGERGLLSCDTTGWENRHIKLQNVTSIFPSITFASWASIFTGKLPNETGITGNEFFARDIYNGTAANDNIPGMSNAGIPKGMVTLDGGSFDPDTYWFVLGHVTPAEFWPLSNDTLNKKSDASAPGKALLTVPLWWDVNEMVDISYQVSPDKYNERCDISNYECRTVSMFNQYTAVVDWWGTPSVNSFLGLRGLNFTKIMDIAAADETVIFIKNYFLQNNPDGKRKRFPAVFSIYLSALDHYAHIEGMDDYSDFFTNTTDPQIKRIVDALKQQDEFDNKIFIIVSDHGHTTMPINLPSMPGDDGKTYEADTSCKLEIKGFDKANKQYPELANNNLHIWELGGILKAVGSIQNAEVRNKYKLLVPEKIEEVFENKGVPSEYRPSSDIGSAEIVVAFNGPMAHIYSMIGTDNKTLGEIAETLRVMLGGYYPSEAKKWLGFSSDYKYLKFQALKIGRLWESIDKILIRMEDDKYYVFDGLDTNGYPVPLSIGALSDTEYIDAVTRITGMNSKERSGDIVLIMNDKTTGSANNRYTTGVSCKSWHGSLNPSDSYVPLIMAYPGGNNVEIEKIIRKDTVCKEDYSNCRGNWKIPNIIKELLKEQYQ
jgi:predicted AlkP superfamily pyrophosphatase or phosphodiesterase